MGKKRKAEFESVLQAKDCLKIFTFNVEAFATVAGARWLAQIVLVNKTMMVVDESTRIKNPRCKAHQKSLPSLAKIQTWSRN